MLNISVMEINLLEVPATLFIFCLYPLQSQKVLKSVTKETNSLYKYWNNVYHILSRLWTHQYTSTDDINFVTFSTSWGRPTYKPKDEPGGLFHLYSLQVHSAKSWKVIPEISGLHRLCHPHILSLNNITTRAKSSNSE